MYIPNYYEFCCRVNMVAGHHVLEKIPELLLAMGAQKPMVLTDKGVRAAGIVDIVIKAIEDKVSIKTIQDQVPPDHRWTSNKALPGSLIRRYERNILFLNRLQ